MEIPPEVADALGHYVYLYVDPRNEKIMYVGKGVGGRAVSHLWDESESQKVRWLRELKTKGLQPRIDILARNLASDKEARLVERCAIDMVGVSSLTNKVRGHGIADGRESLEEIVLRERAQPGLVRHKVLLFRIQRYYRPGMSDDEIYEGARGVWKIGARRRERAEYAFGVVRGIVRGVYAIDEWHTAGSTKYKFRPRAEVDNPERWEFTGKIAPPEVRDLYLHKSVCEYFKKGQQNPVSFVNGRS